jgi:hypothetical protein
MKTVTSLFSVMLICALLPIFANGQNKGANKDACAQEGGPVERKDDRFTGEATVTLKPQALVTAALGQQLQLALAYKIKPKVRGREESIIPEMVTVTFTSTSAKRVYAGDFDLIFLVDGERVRGVPAAVHDDYSRYSTEKIMIQTVLTGMSVETLKRIAHAKAVEMKLGDTEVKLSLETLTAIRSFAICALSRQ